MPEETLDDGGQFLESAQRGDDQLLHLIGAGDDLFADLMVLGMVPNLLNQVDLGGAGWKEIDRVPVFHGALRQTP